MQAHHAPRKREEREAEIPTLFYSLAEHFRGREAV